MSDREELLEVFKGEVSDQLDALDDMVSLASQRWNVDELFHLAHNVKGAGRMIGARGVAEVAHQLEELFSAARRGAKVDPAMVSAVRDGLALLRTCLDHFGSGADPEIGDYRDRVARALARSKPPRRAPDASAPETAEERVPPPERQAPAPGASTVRIGIEKLQALTGLGTEALATAHRTELRRALAARLFGMLGDLRRKHPELRRSRAFQDALQASRELVTGLHQDSIGSSRLSEQFHDAIHQLRMVQIDTVRGLLVRAVRDAAGTAEREVELRTQGGDTEVDRAILDQLRDPLVHLVRNAVAHGIEAPDARRAAGKPTCGVVTLAARSAGSWVEIVVEDDGRGVDLERLRRKAVSQGLVDAKDAAALGVDGLLDLVFQPGLSTADQVSELAGRGFGMDIVRTNLAEIGGTVSISSFPGRGTQVRLRAPLTLLTIRALVVMAAGQPMAFPMMGLQRTVAVRRSDIRTVDAVEVISADDTLVPVSHVARLLGLGAAAQEEGPAVILAEGNRQRALLVDEIVGERELTIQALPWNLSHVPGIAGASATESGDVLLVLNAHELVVARSTPARDIARPQSDGARRQFRILVVDDSVTSRTLEKNILSSAGYDVLTAVNGQQALQMLRDHPVDLVVTDVDMPLMNGIELTRAIRGTQGHQDLPVILVTSLGSDQDKQRGADAGADAYIVKGAFDQDELLNAVSRLL